MEKYGEYVKILLDVLEQEDGLSLWGTWDFISKKLWSLVRDVVTLNMGSRAMHVEMRPKDVGQRLLWTLIYFVSAMMYAGRP